MSEKEKVAKNDKAPEVKSKPVVDNKPTPTNKPEPPVNEYLEMKRKINEKPRGVLEPGLNVEEAKVYLVNLINSKNHLVREFERAHCNTKDLVKAFDNAIKSLDDKLQGRS